MLRLKKQIHDVEDEKLALPGAQPLTLIQVSSDNLPYGCQCPLCGGIFELPQGILYKLEEDDIADIDSDAEVNGPGPGATGKGFFEDTGDIAEAVESAPTASEPAETPTEEA